MSPAPMTRRSFALATSAALFAPFLAPGLARGASATRQYRAYRGKSAVGGQAIAVSRSGGSTVVDVQTKLKVKILGITAYQYSLTSREIWEGGVLQKLTGQGNDNGKKMSVSAQRTSGGLKVAGSRFDGVVKGNPGSSTIFVPDLLKRDTWVSTMTGKPMSVAVAKRGQTSLSLPSGTIACTHYHCAGQLKIPLDVYFTPEGEMAAYMFDAKGARARVVASSLDQEFSPLWG